MLRFCSLLLEWIEPAVYDSARSLVPCSLCRLSVEDTVPRGPTSVHVCVHSLWFATMCCHVLSTIRLGCILVAQTHACLWERRRMSWEKKLRETCLIHHLVWNTHTHTHGDVMIYNMGTFVSIMKASTHDLTVQTALCLHNVSSTWCTEFEISPKDLSRYLFWSELQVFSTPAADRSISLLDGLIEALWPCWKWLMANSPRTPRVHVC